MKPKKEKPAQQASQEETKESGKPKEAKAPKQPNNQQKKAEEPSIPDISQMDIRVGKIVKVWKHPESTKLYCEEVDIGNGEIRKIASGLQEFVPLEAMDGALCVVLCNLKAKKLAGYESHGMVLCGETETKSVVELI